MDIDLRRLPFSTSGSYLVFSVVENALVLKDVHGGHESDSQLFTIAINGHTNIYSVEFMKDYELTVDECYFKCRKRNKLSDFLEITFINEYGFYLQCQGITVTFRPIFHQYNTFYQLSKSFYEFISYYKDQRYGFNVRNGRLNIVAPWNKVENTKIQIENDPELFFELTFWNYKVSMQEIKRRSVGTFETEKRIQYRHLANFRKLFEVKDTNQSFDLATYLLWINQVRSEGALTCRCLYMSKNQMQNIWSWDNCFSALALGKKFPQLAYQQFQVFFEKQNNLGAYPDFINDKTFSFSCVKPPIHAWAYELLRQGNGFFDNKNRLLSAYNSISRNTKFWFEQRRHPITGLYYYSHGNDSGWDNASVFKAGMPVSSPDLVAFLAKQCWILARWAEIVAPKQVDYWRNEAHKLIESLLQNYYDEETSHFFARQAFTGEPIVQQSSLLLMMPLFVAELLPKQIVNDCVEMLRDKFETEYGLATEQKDSQLYVSSGYWLGPVWAPVNYMLLQTLQDNGYTDFSARLERKFRTLVTVGGMAENYDAISGKGNDDLGFTWSAAVYLILSQSYYKK